MLFYEKCLTEKYCFRIVDEEYGDGYATDRAAGLEVSSVSEKVVSPIVSSRMEQWNNISGFDVDPCDVRSPYDSCSLNRTKQDFPQLFRLRVVER